MRTGGYTVHQTLTSDAVAVVKQSISLARRRGHAQVTPLHVATAMLASSAGLLRTACLQSHSHPLQCKALELCFNVALNRLPTSATSGPILGLPRPHHHHHPSLSNALIAAFKRAQAHQRRGSIENQQQPILALKVELEQLVISILDDPSVSRVMREAGFSSTQVKNNVEKAVSLEVICSQSPLPGSLLSTETTKPPVLGSNVCQFQSMTQSRVTINAPKNDRARTGDVTSVLDSLMSKKMRNTVVVGESPAAAEAVVRGVIDRFDGGDVAADMKSVQFISLPLLTLKNIPIDEAEQKLGELRCLVKSYVRNGVVLYLGDLKWVSEFWSSYGRQSRNYSSCPLSYMIMELSRLVFGMWESGNGKLWLMGVANFQTYMKCKTGQPSLETLWQLHPLTIPIGSLGLSLNLERDLLGQFQSKESGEVSNWLEIKFGVGKNLTCCTDCLSKFNKEAQSMATNTYYKESTATSTSSSLPSWLQQYKEESKRKTINNDQEFNRLRELCKKWNLICSSVHKQSHFPEKDLNFSSSSPSSSTSVSSHDQGSHNLRQTLLNWPMISEPKQSHIEHQFFISENGNKGIEPSFRRYIPERNYPKNPDLLSNPNSSPNSASSSEANEEDDQCFFHGFKELNSRNLKALSNALEKMVPWQKDIIQDIASTVLECRSGMVKRKSKLKHREEEEEENKQETWLFFLGGDLDGKEKIAKELAKIVFGSYRNFVTIGLSSFSSTRADSSEEFSNKRSRDESGSSYLERFAEVVKNDPSRVFFVEDLEQVDYFSQKGIKKAMETGRITVAGGGESVPLKDAIVIFSGESFSSMSRACSPPIRSKSGEKNEDDDDEDDPEDRTVCASLDLNIATGYDSGDEHSVADIGILDSVDGHFIFKIQVL
ncbi:hypothetical protein U1Q18_049684 [Sarracenia purpurea var. burkii]